MRYLEGMRAEVMLVTMLTMVAILLSGCGRAEWGGSPPPVEPADDYCLVEQLEDGTYISCPDSDVFIPAPVDESDPDPEDIVECRRGEGHKKHTHEHHEHCE